MALPWVDSRLKIFDCKNSNDFYVPVFLGPSGIRFCSIAIDTSTGCMSGYRLSKPPATIGLFFLSFESSSRLVFAQMTEMLPIFLSKLQALAEKASIN
jgi:hypothetical protein